MSTPATPAILGLPRWPIAPEPVDATGNSWLVVACGADPRVREVAAAWVAEATGNGPTTLVAIDSADGTAAVELVCALDQARTGVRIAVVGDQYDVLVALALARSHGAASAELRSFVIDGAALPIFCAHCRDTHRVEAVPEQTVDCPGCGRHVEIHQHHSAHRGSYLASDSRAREIA